MKLFEKINTKQKGQSLVEFAITLTIMMTLLAGAVEFGIALFQYVQLRDAVQEGASYGSLNPDDNAGIIAHVLASSDTPINLQAEYDAGRLVITPTVTEDSVVETENCEGDGMQVAISYPHKVSMPFVSAIIGSQFIQIKVNVTNTILTPICP